MKKENNNPQKSSLLERTRPIQIALLIIAMAIGSVMIFNRGNATSTNNKAKESAAVMSDENSKVVILTDQVFNEIISEGVTLVDFWATWCPPCRIQNPIIEQVAIEMGDIAKIAKLDVDHNPNSARANSVQNIPTLIIFKDGKPVQRFVGVQQKETLIAAIRNHIGNQ
jgi:thioredoxin 1